MDCESTKSELVECARQRVTPSVAASTHLANCASCRDYEESERALTVHLRAVREAVQTPANEAMDHAWRKAALMCEFDAYSKKERNLRRVRTMSWGMSAAAALFVTVGAVRMIDFHTPQPPVADPVREYAAPEYAQQSFQPAVDAGEKGFVAVPFAPPLAQGEIVRIVRTELHPAALASMGISVDPGWSGDLPADLLVGQDGLTRAWRLSDDEGNDTLY